METLTGIAASSGIAIGRVQVVSQEEHIIREITLDSPAKIRRELSQFSTALRRTQGELKRVHRSLARHLGPDEARILDSHLRLLTDVTIVDRTREAIIKEKKNAAFIFKRTVKEAVAALQTIKDKYLHDRVYEIKDVYHRVLNHLLEDFAEGADSIARDEKIILVAHSLPPYEFIHFERGNILGVVTEIGGVTSHFSIIARALDIPAIVGCEEAMAHAKTGQRVIVDGDKGLAILNPDRETLDKYIKSRERHFEQERELLAIRDLPAVTIDGKPIDVAANIELPSEISGVLDHGCRNIGLCRTEFLFMLKAKPPTEDEQTAIYADYLQKMRPGYVVIRTLDIGSDKLSPFIHLDMAEANPAMGMRAIRLCLEDKDLFRTQLRAILRASVHGNLKIMFPMVTSLEELRKVLRFYRSVRAELLDEKVSISPHIEVGIMIEVPSAALTANLLAPEVDFFSIGTNDLSQFVLAADRGNKRLSNLFDPLNPAILRLLNEVVEAAHHHGIWVGVCGEMAGDPLSALLLLGMGVDELSMNAISVLEIKRIVRAITYDDMREIVSKTLPLETSRQIRLFLQREFVRKFRLKHKINFLF